MTDKISGLPFWEIWFDAQGDPDPQRNPTALREISSLGLTDVVMFSHGWNNDHDTATKLYRAWFALLADQVAKARPNAKVGLVGIYWPSQRWSDEPIPDFTASAAGRASGAAGLADKPKYDYSCALTPAERGQLEEAFPGHADDIARMAELLDSPPVAPADSAAGLAEFLALLAGLPTTQDVDDAEHGSVQDRPPMLQQDPSALFGSFTAALVDTGAVFSDTASGEGAAGLGDLTKKLWNGAKEALRAMSYYDMKNRAGVVGRGGVATFITQLHAAAPAVRVHLVGHSFGARLVSNVLAGLPDDPRPVKSITLLQGAFSHFAFAAPLPFDATRKGSLAGTLLRLDGPLTVAFSSHDSAVGRFYPLASITSRDDSAALADSMYRWGAMGHDGAQASQALLDSIQPAHPNTQYRFRDGQALNVDASEIVCHGTSPAGAHSDIVHRELTWLTLKAAKIL